MSMSRKRKAVCLRANSFFIENMFFNCYNMVNKILNKNNDKNN